jgi:thiol-disulfide isomerase/thioredoxin
VSQSELVAIGIAGDYTIAVKWFSLSLRGGCPKGGWWSPEQLNGFFSVAGIVWRDYFHNMNNAQALMFIRRRMFLFIFLAVMFACAVKGDDNPNPKKPQPRCAVGKGQKAPAFKVRSLDGKVINFPADYKGKVVMVDFWATWCEPCKEELPNVTAVYEKNHPNGFEVISVSLDGPGDGPMLLQFVHDHGMTWPQVYDGGAWKASIAVEYGVHSIPCPVVVDGDTGKVLAVGVGALGDRLTKVVETALDEKGKKEK